MTHHKYIARMGGHQWRLGPEADCNSLKEAKEFAESYGDTADTCLVLGQANEIIALYRREGRKWFRAEPPSL